MRNAFASLTSRLVLTTVALVLLVSVVIGTVTTLAMRSYLTDQLDQNVQDALQNAVFLRATSGPGAFGPPPGPAARGDAGSLTALHYPGATPSWYVTVTTQRSNGESWHQ